MSEIHTRALEKNIFPQYQYGISIAYTETVIRNFNYIPCILLPFHVHHALILNECSYQTKHSCHVQK